MISLVLPYWQRQEVTNTALALLEKHYSNLDMEVVIVDDGDPIPFAKPDHSFPWPIEIIRLPEKQEPCCSGVPINLGVDVARGDFIAISGPEMMHLSPILPLMRGEILWGGYDTYVTAAVWFPDGKCWHAHSSIAGRVCEGVKMPRAGYHFMSMCHISLWKRSGGFDEDYRDGAGYDDNDFLLRLERAGAKFVMRDDLVVEHTRKDARSRWKPEQFEKNKALFNRKWSRSPAAKSGTISGAAQNTSRT